MRFKCQVLHLWLCRTLLDTRKMAVVPLDSLAWKRQSNTQNGPLGDQLVKCWQLSEDGGILFHGQRSYRDSAISFNITTRRFMVLASSIALLFVTGLVKPKRKSVLLDFHRQRYTNVSTRGVYPMQKAYMLASIKTQLTFISVLLIADIQLSEY